MTRQTPYAVRYTPRRSLEAGGTVVTDAQLVYRLLLAVDIQGYSARNAKEQLVAQRELSAALSRAANDLGLDRDLWDKQVGGDGELAILPPGADIPKIVGEFPRRLTEELNEYNRLRTEGRPLRVRLAMHHGTLIEGPFGPAGEAPVEITRLLDADQLRALLGERTADPLVFAISAALYEEVVQSGFCALDPSGFKPVELSVKGIRYSGYLYHDGR
ncbi:hypothetical protein DPM19_00275 [Actinomadura craniellae]|uniref:Uncharacterized protein n=1 Tax=Actinomadura craniellae TaxID=2231787 RepID=A0A365HC40_9ACTN|nr:hypothetical protein [Actinomadura craniellae]RAY16661.1 hypothetical protein DPM19_00275 [Actinomadura craniellae]